MRWNLAIAVIVGLVLAIAVTFGGPILRGSAASPPPQISK
jgi:hypothetical protein